MLVHKMCSSASPSTFVALQIGGSDQWGNITAGTDLVRRLLGKGDSSQAQAAEDGSTALSDASSCYGLTFPLLVRARISHIWCLSPLLPSIAALPFSLVALQSAIFDNGIEIGAPSLRQGYDTGGRGEVGPYHRYLGNLHKHSLATHLPSLVQ